MKRGWECDPGGLHVCMKLEKKTDPFDAASKVAMTWAVQNPCGRVLGGTLELLMSPQDAEEHYIGDEISLRMRPI
jgi:hypothetical protein